MSQNYYYSQQQQQNKPDTHAKKPITGAVTDAGLIQITSTGHSYSTGQKVRISGVGGTVEANGTWTITVINANAFDLQGSTFTNAYTSGGIVTLD